MKTIALSSFREVSILMKTIALSSFREVPLLWLVLNKRWHLIKLKVALTIGKRKKGK